MEIVPFVARTAAEAFARIQAQMGPEAVVLNVRQLPVAGLARLWRRPRIEVLACPPGLFKSAPPHAATDIAPPASLSTANPANPGPTASFAPVAEEASLSLPLRSSRWRVGTLLANAGFQPLATQRLLDDIEAHHGPEPPTSLPREIAVLRETLRQHWMVADPVHSGAPQVLVGPSGSGKTTLLCKWLTKQVLLEGRAARVYRIDGTRANTSEILDVHAVILGVPVVRGLSGVENCASGEWRFVDVPGVDWRDPAAIGELRRSLDKISGAEVHLVLNGAYEVPVLLAQVRAFSPLSLKGLMVTHLDEENRWAKLWNLVLSGPLALRFLSSGQNIPGEFVDASPERLNDRWLGPR
jgi:flagellar biosynthesis protein FlhF